MFDYEPLRNIVKDNADHLLTLQRNLGLSTSFTRLFHSDIILTSEDIAKLSCYYKVPARDFVEYDFSPLPCYNPVIVKLDDVDNPIVSYKPFREMFSEWCDETNGKSIGKYLENIEDINIYGRTIYALKNDKEMSMKVIYHICKFLRCHLDYVVDYK